MLSGKLHFAFVAGIFAALGSVFGKLSGSTDVLDRFINILRVIPNDKKVSTSRAKLSQTFINTSSSI
jgi:hypothetical protein